MKLCWWCRSCFFDHADPGYSEYTPGNDASLSCLKGYWEIDFFNDSLTSLAEKMQKAQTCKDWNPIETWRDEVMP